MALFAIQQRLSDFAIHYHGWVGVQAPWLYLFCQDKEEDPLQLWNIFLSKEPTSSTFASLNFSSKMVQSWVSTGLVGPGGLAPPCQVIEKLALDTLVRLD